MKECLEHELFTKYPVLEEHEGIHPAQSLTRVKNRPKICSREATLFSPIIALSLDHAHVGPNEDIPIEFCKYDFHFLKRLIRRLTLYNQGGTTHASSRAPL